jgi:hypothetical protein
MAIAVVFASFGATTAQGAEGDAAAPVLEPFDLNAMVFPLISERDPIYDSFDDCRGSGCSRLHGAIDIMRPKMTPVVAVADGVVSWMGTVEEGKCCYVFIDHPGDYKTGYIHLNNDTPGTDDGLANGIAEGITEGTVVRKGQLIGWVGDSGNAEYAGSHLHLEIRYYGNGYEERINPYPYLLTAPILSEPGGAPAPEPQPEPVPFIGPSFTDDDGSPHEPDIERLLELGVTRGCSETEYCPQDSITRGQMAAFVRRYLDLPTGGSGVTYIDTDGHLFAEDIEAITEAGIGFGCSEFDYCPDAPLTRQEMARFLVGTFDIPLLEAPAGVFDDIDANPFAEYIEAIQAVGVTLGCTETTYCPADVVTREQMASFFVRGHDLD